MSKIVLPELSSRNKILYNSLDSPPRGRVYTYENDLRKAQLIRFVRSLDFSILEIKEVLEIVNDDADLTYILQEKIANIYLP